MIRVIIRGMKVKRISPGKVRRFSQKLWGGAGEALTPSLSPF